MRIIKCDLCKKKIKEQPIIILAGFLAKSELCEKCSAPILRFLKKNKLIKKDLKKKNRVWHSRLFWLK